MLEVYYQKFEYLKDDTVFLKHLNTMPQHISQRILKSKQKADQKRSLAAWKLCFKLLKKWTLCTDVEYAPSGKPYLKEDSNIFFNLSHSGKYVACAISDSEVGVDIQQYKNVNELVMKKFMSKEEQEYILSSSSQHQKTQRFFQVWTGKESVIKYSGNGLKEIMQGFSIFSMKDKQICYHEIQENYAISVCCKKMSEDVIFKQFFNFKEYNF